MLGGVPARRTAAALFLSMLLLRHAALGGTAGPTSRSLPGSRLHRRGLAFLLRTTPRMMPEGPEVKSLTDCIHARYRHTEASSWRLTAARIVSGRYAQKPPEGFDALLEQLPLTLEGVRNKGKFIYFQLGGEGNEGDGGNATVTSLAADSPTAATPTAAAAAPPISVWSTLGMTGGWTLGAHPHTRVELKLCESVTGQTDVLRFYDMRNFGTMTVCFEPERLEKKLEIQLTKLSQAEASNRLTRDTINELRLEHLSKTDASDALERTLQVWGASSSDWKT